MKRAGLELVNRALHLCETRSLRKGRGFNCPPIFIIGPPRSGSTLLFQVIVNTFRVNYTTNDDAKWYGGLSFRKHFFPVPEKESKTDFSSSHGQTTGRYAPHECGEYWYQFFRRKPQYVPSGEADEDKVGKLTRSLRRIISAGGAPMLFKNMNCALRLGPIHKACPEALFIVTHRDILWNSHSLLQVRHKVHGDYGKWWSMEPEEIDELVKLQPENQVIEQVRAIHGEIDRQKNRIGAAHFFDVGYEELCNDPKKVITSINEFFESHNIQILSSMDHVPESFPLSENCRIDASLFEKLKKYAGE